MNFGSCRFQGDNSGNDSEPNSKAIRPELSNQAEFTDSIFTAPKMNHLDTVKLRKDEDLHYDKFASLGGRVTEELNKLGPGIAKSQLQEIGDSESYDILAIEFYYSNNDVQKTGENFSGYVSYYGKSFEDIFPSIVSRRQGDNLEYYADVFYCPRKDGTIWNDSIRSPVDFAILVLDSELKRCKNVFTDGKYLSTNIEKEEFIQQIACSNNLDINEIRTRLSRFPLVKFHTNDFHNRILELDNK